MATYIILVIEGTDLDEYCCLSSTSTTHQLTRKVNFNKKVITRLIVVFIWICQKIGCLIWKLKSKETMLLLVSYQSNLCNYIFGKRF